MPFFKASGESWEESMEFRPCIDIHNGKVKQIIGSSLKDAGSTASENFVSGKDAAFYARLYRSRGLRGGHVIMLNPPGSEHYEATRQQAIGALRAYPQGLQVGGGITAENAPSFIKEGAAAVIVTSYVFRDGRIDYENLDRLVRAVGREHLVLDLSCRYRDDPERGFGYYIVTDRWQKFTDERVSGELLDRLSGSCCEFLIHAVDVEGKSGGIEKPLAAQLGRWNRIPVTYAGGVHSFADLEQLAQLGHGRLNVTIGSALDLFGGPMEFERVAEFCRHCTE
jgi:phosphoribosylformimino-5-aminoimidazole carboxamide ribotide isomerase